MTRKKKASNAQEKLKMRKPLKKRKRKRKKRRKNWKASISKTETIK
jgi:hypothetical protein